jgi:tetratricopeptide (TPR) repeat protein
VRLGLALALALAPGGCTRDGGSETPGEDDGPLPDRARLQTHQAPFLPSESTVSPPAASSPPVPQQDPSVRDRARAARLIQLRQDYAGAYERFGRKNPKWDAAAREALEAWARVQARPDVIGNDAVVPREAGRRALEGNRRSPDSGCDDQVVAWKAAVRALAAGCDDPLIHYVFAWLSYEECLPNNGADGNSWAAAAAGMRTSNYPALLRAYALARQGDYLTRQAYGRNNELPEAQALFDEALALMPEITRQARTDPTKARSPYHLGTLLVEGLVRLPGQERSPSRRWQALEKGLTRVLKALDSDPANQMNEMLLAGDRYNYLGWELRGGGPAIEVSSEGWSDFDARLGQAERALTRVYELDPSCPDVARLMIEVEKGQGRGRDRMEMWFERAMRLNGDDYFACRAKLEYLEPRWYGSEAEMLAFARACRDTNNWEGRLPFILIEAHRRLARISLASHDPRAPQEGYYGRPYVWDDVQSVYDPYLKLHPDSRYDKSCYARLAVLAGKYALANRLFEELGNGWWRSVFSGADYDWMRRTAQTGKPARWEGEFPPTRRGGREQGIPGEKLSKTSAS